ncbi:MAG: type phosphodiesterase/nucleotide pyrophosphatase [Myxococcaceae bacterium]|nr:type phosphodiesterase/nucleotide pyrophosphatase [Myxococcaceae bacterium]
MQTRHVIKRLCISCLPLFSACGSSALEDALAGSASELGQSLEGDGPKHQPGWKKQIEHVLLLSVDGMHQQDLHVFLAAHPGSALSSLSAHGVQYDHAFVNRLDGSPTNPSDSFPGLLALTTGGSSPTTGGWYDVSYARDLYAFSASAPCSGRAGTMVTYDESIELDHTSLWGSSTDDVPTHDPKVVRSRLDPRLLPYRKAQHGCEPVYPHDYIRVNTIFEVAQAAGMHTAWSDKHLAYELVSGPSGRGLDDFFAPEINSSARSLVPDAVAGADFTSDYRYTKIYDDFKASALVKQIAGLWSDSGLTGATDAVGEPGVPAIFGMNFQALSVAQKSSKADGGYADALGTPNAQVADALVHTDAAIGRLVAALEARDLLASTLIIVTAKHGQSPIDAKLLARVDGDAVAAQLDAVASVAGHIEDDVGLYWLRDGQTAAAGALALQSGPVDAQAAQVFRAASPHFSRMFGDPARDPRTPDLIVQPKVGVVYSLSAKKQAEHGGFAEDDSHVALLVSNPSFVSRTESTEVRTKQVAPTILEALDLDARRLEAVRKEDTRVLPGLGL